MDSCEEMWGMVSGYFGILVSYPENRSWFKMSFSMKLGEERGPERGLVFGASH